MMKTPVVTLFLPLQQVTQICNLLLEQGATARILFRHPSRHA